MKKSKVILLVLVLFGSSCVAQPFINEINQFRKADSLQAPPQRPILFIGSSSFTYWKDVQEYFPGRTILNRAFGGSSLTHLILYADDVIFRYQPKQIKTLFFMIREKLPTTPVLYLSMKPSPSRRKYLPLIEAGNQKIKAFLTTQRQGYFLDVYTAMLTPQGTIRGDIFTADSLHMNKKGYALWQPLLEPLLHL
ncbi:MAG: G-D-S-L family lipolytic protein [Chitinophagales bacterium]|nr:G-D-S-L family lipolytic protein [Chitinophagales bacterium]